MSDQLRITLRIGGLLAFLLGVAMIVVVVVIGPFDLARMLGESCGSSRPGRRSRQCNVIDVLEWLWIAPFLILGGGLMALLLGPSDKPIQGQASGTSGLVFARAMHWVARAASGGSRDLR